MLHPVQTLLSLPGSDLIATASAGTLTTFSTSSSTLLATSTPHTALIRLLTTYTDPSTSTTYLISTGEDKLLVVSSLPSLETLSTRELIKRANALSVTAEGEIVVGDKFGDVYTYPLIAPPAPAIPADAPKILPILGHVSMLNALVLIPASSTSRALIISGDRDEHVRVSRFPRGHNIEKFLWGSKNFVSALSYLPPTTASPAPLILSAGGDPTFQTFDLSTGALLSRFPIEELLLPHVVVVPYRPPPVMGKKRPGKKAKRAKEEAALLEAKGEDGDAVEEEQVEEVQGEEGQMEEVQMEEVQGEEGKTHWRERVAKGLAVVKIVQVGDRESGGVVVLATGCTAILYIPYALIIPSSAASTATPSLLDLKHPILDLSTTSTTSAFYLSLDLSKSPDSTDSPIRHVAAIEHALVLSPLSPLESLLSSSAVPLTDSLPLPSPDSLYPVLSLLHQPEQSGVGDETILREESGKKIVEDKGTGGGQSGKRAKGRAEAKRRADEAGEKKRKAEEMVEG